MIGRWIGENSAFEFWKQGSSHDARDAMYEVVTVHIFIVDNHNIHCVKFDAFFVRQV